jgi:ribosomal protein L34
MWAKNEGERMQTREGEQVHTLERKRREGERMQTREGEQVQTRSSVVLYMVLYIVNE